MKILALELSSGQGSIAWMGDGQILEMREFANDRKHSGMFFENLQQTLQAFGPADRIVVGLGPGSYAGTRIAIATAIGLQAATSGELLGLPSFCAMPTNENDYAVIGDARRETFFFARVSNRRCVEGPTLQAPDELTERLKDVTTPIFSTEPLVRFGRAIVNHPSARILAEIAATASVQPSGAPLEPMYLREPHITQPKGATS